MKGEEEEEKCVPMTFHIFAAVFSFFLSFVSFLFLNGILNVSLSRLAGLPGFSGLAGFSLLATTAAPASTAALVATLALVAVGFTLAVLVVAGEVGDGQALGEVDLRADRVGEVADHEDILDVVVEVMFYLGGVHLGREG